MNKFSCITVFGQGATAEWLLCSTSYAISRPVLVRSRCCSIINYPSDGSIQVTTRVVVTSPWQNCNLEYNFNSEQLHHNLYLGLSSVLPPEFHMHGQSRSTNATKEYLAEVRNTTHRFVHTVSSITAFARAWVLTHGPSKAVKLVSPFPMLWSRLGALPGGEASEGWAFLAERELPVWIAGSAAWTKVSCAKILQRDSSIIFHLHWLCTGSD